MTALQQSAPALRARRGRGVPTTWGARRMRGVLASIAAKTLALFIFVTLAPLAVALVQTRSDALGAEGRALESARSVARGAADEVQESIRAAQRTSKILSRMPAFWDG